MSITNQYQPRQQRSYFHSKYQPVKVVKFRLGDGVVDVDSGNGEFALFRQLIQAMDACEHQESRKNSGLPRWVVTNWVPLPWTKQNLLPPTLTRDGFFNDALALVELIGVLFDHPVSGVASVVENQVRLPLGGVDALVDAPPKVIFCFPLPSENLENRRRKWCQRRGGHRKRTMCMKEMEQNEDSAKNKKEKRKKKKWRKEEEKEEEKSEKYWGQRQNGWAGAVMVGRGGNGGR